MTWDNAFILLIMCLVKTAIRNKEWEEFLSDKAFCEEIRRQIEVRNLEYQNNCLSKILLYQRMLMQLRNKDINWMNPNYYQGTDQDYGDFLALTDPNIEKKTKSVSLIDNGMTKQILYNDEGLTEHEVGYFDCESSVKADKSRENNFRNISETGCKNLDPWQIELIGMECRRRIALDNQKKQKDYSPDTDFYWGSMDTNNDDHSAILKQIDPLKREETLPEKKSIGNRGITSSTSPNKSRSELFLDKDISKLSRLTPNQPQQPKWQKTGIGLDSLSELQTNTLSLTVQKNNEERKNPPLFLDIYSNLNESEESYVFEKESKKFYLNNPNERFLCPNPLFEINPQNTEKVEEIQDLIDLRENPPSPNSTSASGIHLQERVSEEYPQKQPISVIVEYHYLENKKVPSSESCLKLCCQKNIRKYARKCLRVDLTEVFIKEKNNTDFCYLEPDEFRRSVVSYFSKNSKIDTTAEIIADTIFSHLINKSPINVITVAVLLKFFLKDFEKLGNFCSENHTTVNFFNPENKSYVKPNIKLSIIASIAWWNLQKYELSSFSKTLFIIFDAVLRNFLAVANLQYIDPSYLLYSFTQKIIEGMRYFVCQASDRGVTGLKVVN
ncbi:hypothetical protein TUBRATIS_15880 [Tubulinosema ratisbonensis]|uniref:Uncharacterized protein n=1 Tax=Tubulinosema ratisbonensis TaxID=291195 RepID=A0A437ALU3_9MICR|nr:hypothetical protein TUBRATIS_15880 [Tubulinosema ratisbonensis]